MKILNWKRLSLLTLAMLMLPLLINTAFAQNNSSTVEACQVDYTITSQWNSGYQADVVITNDGPANITGWELDWTFEGDETFGAGWNASFNHNGQSVTAMNSAGHWNGTIVANGGTVAFGFQGTHNGNVVVPTHFVLNGVPCGDVATPTPMPTSTPRPNSRLTIEGYARLNGEDGPGVPNVNIYRQVASYPFQLVATTDANGYYQTEPYNTYGHQETISLRAELTGYTFEPAMYLEIFYGQGDSLWQRDFVAPLSLTPTPTDTPTPTIPNRYQLDVSAEPLGGSVLLDPPADADGLYAEGTTVTLTASPDVHYDCYYSPYWSFASWGGDVSSSEATITVVMNSDTSLIAYFSEYFPPSCSTPTVPIPTPTVAACQVDYAMANVWQGGYQANVTITNNASTDIAGWELGWEFAGDETLTGGWNAEFASNGQSMTASNPAGHWNGTIRANGGTVSFGVQFTHSGEAVAPSTFTVNGLTCGDDVATPIPTITPTPTANVERYQLDLSSEPVSAADELTANPLPDTDGLYADGTSVTIVVSPNQFYSCYDSPQHSPYWTFLSWGGDVSGSESTITVVMDSDKTIIGNFEMAPPPPCPPPPSPTPPPPPTPTTTPGGTVYQSSATHFDSFPESGSGCGVPWSIKETPHFVALNVQDTPGDYGTFLSRPISSANADQIGLFDNGRNCGRWVRVTIGDRCVSPSINDGAPGMGFCHPSNDWASDGYNGATLDMLVMDSCQDGNGWCRDDTNHLDLATDSINQFVKDGQPVGDMLPNSWGNRQISWEFIEAPSYQGDIEIGFVQSAQRYWPTILITHLENGIHGVEYLQEGQWISAEMVSDQGQKFIIGPTVEAGLSYTIRAYDVNDQLIQSGREYSFEFPSASCGGSCGATYTPVSYTVN